MIHAVWNSLANAGSERIDRDQGETLCKLQIGQLMANLICSRLHFINRSSGKLLGAEEE